MPIGTSARRHQNLLCPSIRSKTAVLDNAPPRGSSESPAKTGLSH
jgi:hypothetical protein